MAFKQISEMTQSQTAKYATSNEADRQLRVLTQCDVIDRDLTTPPGSPSKGDIYIPKATATGDWAGHEDDLAFYSGSAWQFLSPDEGWIVYVKDENLAIYYTGSAWKPLNPEDVVQAKASGDTVNIDWSLGGMAEVLLDRATTTFAFSGAKDGQKCVLVLKQDGTGGRAAAFGSECRGGTDLSLPPSLTATANKTDYLGFIYRDADSKYDFVSFAKGY